VKWVKWAKWMQWAKWVKWVKGVKWVKWVKWLRWVQAHREGGAGDAAALGHRAKQSAVAGVASVEGALLRRLLAQQPRPQPRHAPLLQRRGGLGLHGRLAPPLLQRAERAQHPPTGRFVSWAGALLSVGRGAFEKTSSSSSQAIIA
jgi:hypothetical protein